MNKDRDNILCEYSDEESAFIKGALSSDGCTEDTPKLRMVLNAKEYILCDFSMYDDMTEEDASSPECVTGDEVIANAFSEAEKSPSSEEYSVICEATIKECDNGRTVISYVESLDGENEQTTEISFEKNNPGLVTICKSGLATTVMTIESGKRHSCVYRTPFMDFEMRVHALRVDNSVTAEGGKLRLDYALEIRGAAAHRTIMEITLA